MLMPTRTRLLFAILAAPLACGPSTPDASVACPALTEQWESGGHLRVIDCRSSGGALDEDGDRYTMELELDLEVLAKTQIYAKGPIVHKRGPEGSGHERPAGEVVTVREQAVLVQTEDGWENRL